MKLCTDCKISKPIEEFSINRQKKDGHNFRCKLCQRIYFKGYYAKNKSKQMPRVQANKAKTILANKIYLEKLKSFPCMDCGNTFPSCAMDFDHVRGTKFKNVSRLITCSNETILKEIDKCDLVCSNCHRVRTQKRIDNKNNLNIH